MGKLIGGLAGEYEYIGIKYEEFLPIQLTRKIIENHTCTLWLCKSKQ